MTPSRPRRPPWGPVTVGTALLALLLATGMVAGAAAPAAARDHRAVRASRGVARATLADPLTVSLTHVAPAVVPTQGPVTLRGTVTNSSDDTWTSVIVYPFLSPEPITSAAALATAAATDPDEVPGSRVFDVGRPATYQRIERLDPGASATFSVRVPHADLDKFLGQRTPGAYWCGIQVLGADSAPRDDLADGRAYTFLPLLGHRSADAATPVAVVVPLRRTVNDNRDGRLRGAVSWGRDISAGGRLADLLQLGEAAAPGRLTWLVDPAVLDAVRRLSLGNPARALTATGGTTGTPSSGPSTTATADDATVPVAVRRAAANWLQRMLAVLRRTTVLALPYGDLDVAGASLRDPSMVQRAATLSATYFSGAGVTARPAVAAPSGWLKPAALATIDPATTVLASDAVAGRTLPAGRVPPPAAVVGAHTVDLYDASASAGGPGDLTTPLALRQRLLAEAALRARRPDPAPLVVSLPADWDPGATGGRLVSGLGRRWLSLVTLPEVSTTDLPTVPVDDLVYPAHEAAAELPPPTFTAADGLRRAGTTLQALLVGPSTVGDQVLAQVLSGLSYDERDHSARSTGRARSATDRIQADLKQVTVSTPDFVTLSSPSGNRFRVDLSNALPAAVRVRLDPVVDPGLEIGTPGVITIEGGARTSALLTARSGRLGYHQVDLQLTTAGNVRLGSGAELPVRSSRTGRIIWVIVAGGAALLVGAIATRLVRRFRRYRLARHGVPSP